MPTHKETNFDAYKRTEISTANQEKLILMLYDGAIKFLKQAGDNMEPRKYDMVNNSIIRSQDIITELMLALNMEEGGEVAANLFNLYAYMKKRLLEANIAKSSDMLEEIISLLQQLYQAWEQAFSSSGYRHKRVSVAEAGISIQG